jgi:hypothetical protein
MDEKTKGLGGFVKSFGKIIKEFLFGKEGGGEGTEATGGVMGWMAKNLSADKVSGAIIGVIDLAVAFGKMLGTIAMNALIGTNGKVGQPETWDKKSLYGFINKEIEPRLPAIGKAIGKGILALLGWISDVVGNVAQYITDALIAAGKADDASLLSQGIGSGLEKLRDVDMGLNPEFYRDRWIKAHGGRQDLSPAKDTTWYKEMAKRALKANADEQKVAEKLEEKRLSDIKRLGPEGHGKISADPSLWHSTLTKLFGGKAITFDFPTKDNFKGMEFPTTRTARTGVGEWYRKGSAMWPKGLGGDKGMGGFGGATPTGWSALMEATQTRALGLNRLFSNLEFSKFKVTSGHRTDSHQKSLMANMESLKHYDDFWKNKLIAEGARRYGEKNKRLLVDSSQAGVLGRGGIDYRKEALEYLFSDAVGFTSSHQHGTGLDFAWPTGKDGKRVGIDRLKRLITGDMGMYPGMTLVGEGSHLHLQPSDSMLQRMRQAQGLNNAALDTSMGMGGTTIINNNTNVGGIDQSTNSDSTNVFGSSTENKHTSVNHDLSFGLGTL